MRMRHLLTTLITSVGVTVAGLAAPMALSAADAANAPYDAASAARTVSVQQARGDKPTRDLHDSVVKKRGKLFLKGRVDPGHGPVIVQKKLCKAKRCHWKSFKKVATHGPREKWQVRIYAPRRGNWYWRGFVNANAKYAKSWTHAYRTYTTTF
jgi:Ni/Co efflux regulator RcnB